MQTSWTAQETHIKSYSETKQDETRCPDQIPIPILDDPNASYLIIGYDNKNIQCKYDRYSEDPNDMNHNIHYKKPRHIHIA